MISGLATASLMVTMATELALRIKCQIAALKCQIIGVSEFFFDGL